MQKKHQEHPKDAGGNATIACKRSTTGVVTIAEARSLYQPRHLVCQDCSKPCQR